MAENAPRQVPFTPPKWLNQVMKFVLRSPLHVLVSKTLLLLTFTGRKSGKVFDAPVGYVQQGDVVTIFTDHPWWKNLRDNPAVRLRLRGKTFSGNADVLHGDQERLAKELEEFVRHRLKGARAYGVKLDATGQPDLETVRMAATRFTRIHIQLDKSIL